MQKINSHKATYNFPKGISVDSLLLQEMVQKNTPEDKCLLGGVRTTRVKKWRVSESGSQKQAKMKQSFSFRVLLPTEVFDKFQL